MKAIFHLFSPELTSISKWEVKVLAFPCTCTSILLVTLLLHSDISPGVSISIASLILYSLICTLLEHQVLQQVRRIFQELVTSYHAWLVSTIMTRINTPTKPFFLNLCGLATIAHTEWKCFVLLNIGLIYMCHCIWYHCNCWYTKRKWKWYISLTVLRHKWC